MRLMYGSIVGGFYRYLRSAIAVVFGLSVGFALVGVTEAALPQLVSFNAPNPKQDSSLTVSWRLRDTVGVESWVQWDVRPRTSGAPRYETAHRTGRRSTETFSAPIKVPADAKTLYFTINVLVDGRLLQFAERKTAVAAGLAAATSVDEAELAVALVLVRDSLGREGSGSAFIVEDGILLTNEHVIADAVAITVIFASGSQSTGSVVGFDVARDLAAIRATTPTTARRLEWNIGGREAIRTDVWAWGYPGSTVASFGASVRPTLTDGIVSQYQSRHGVTYIQTNADIHPGNSGGPLVTEAGRAVGVNSANLVNVQTGASQSGLNLAVSLADHRSAVEAILAGKKSGATVSPPPSATITSLRFTPWYQDGRGDWCDAGQSPNLYPGIAGLCLAANYPTSLIGTVVSLEWRRNGVAICRETNVITSDIQTGQTLFACSPTAMTTGTYSLTINVSGKTLGTLTQHVSVAGAVTSSAVSAYLNSMVTPWANANATIETYSALWNAVIDFESIPSNLLRGYAETQATASRQVLTTLHGLSTHPALSDPMVAATHAAAIQHWNSRVSYHSALAQYASGGPWNAVESGWNAVEQHYEVFRANYCPLLVRWDLGVCQ